MIYLISLLQKFKHIFFSVTAVVIPLIFLCIASVSAESPASENMCFLEQYTPVVESSYYHLADSDETRIDSWQQTGTLSVAPHFDWQASYARARYSEPNITTTHENKFQTGLKYTKDDKAWEIRYGFRDFSNLDGSHEYKVSGTSPLGFLKSVTLTHEYGHWETARAIRAKTKAHISSVSAYQPVAERWLLTSFYQRHEFNDSNSRDLFRQGMYFRVLRDAPELRVGYEHVYYNMDFRSPTYWSPNNLRINRVSGLLVGELWGSKVAYEIGYAMGFAQQKGEEDRIVNSGSAALTYKANKSWEFFVNFELDDEPTYNSLMVRGGIRYHF